MSLLVTVPAAIVLLGAVARMWRTDNRRLSIGVLAALGGFFALESVLAPLQGVLPAGVVYALPLVLLPFFVVVLAVYLIGNGSRVLRAESRSLANALSLVAGLGLLVVPVVMYPVVPAALRLPHELVVLEAILLGLAGLVALLWVYVAAFFVVFLCYGAVYRRSRIGEFDAVVVLGAGLVDGRVPPLLGSRLDRGAELFSARRARGEDCVLIPTGGRGSDEPRAEGEAMAEYLRQAGVPAERVLAETEAENTEQNLLLSRRIAEAQRPGSRVLIVTSDYHVLRAAMLARRVGLPAAATGARTGRHFLPSATLREFAAVAVMFPRIQLAAVAVCVLAAIVAGALLGITGTL